MSRSPAAPLMRRVAAGLLLTASCALPEYRGAPLFPEPSDPRAVRPEVSARQRAGVTVGRPTVDAP